MSRTTLIIDSHGCLHIWKGFRKITYHPTLPKASGSEADLFIQSCDAIETIRDYITPRQANQLENGYVINCTTLPDEYFQS
jgi:hypothetical protein